MGSHPQILDKPQRSISGRSSPARRPSRQRRPARSPEAFNNDPAFWIELRGDIACPWRDQRTLLFESEQDYQLAPSRTWRNVAGSRKTDSPEGLP